MNDAFLIGLAIGVVVGWLARPLFHWWITVQEWRTASREAEIADELLRRLARHAEPTELGP